MYVILIWNGNKNKLYALIFIIIEDKPILFVKNNCNISKNINEWFKTLCFSTFLIKIFIIWKFLDLEYNIILLSITWKWRFTGILFHLTKK